MQVIYTFPDTEAPLFRYCIKLATGSVSIRFETSVSKPATPCMLRTFLY